MFFTARTGPSLDYLGVTADIAALIRMGFWGISYSNYDKEPPEQYR